MKKKADAMSIRRDIVKAKEVARDFPVEGLEMLNKLLGSLSTLPKKVQVRLAEEAGQTVTEALKHFTKDELQEVYEMLFEVMPEEMWAMAQEQIRKLPPEELEKLHSLLEEDKKK